ncbi:MAG: hypothetical protein U1D30_26090 [Planctomycetota bacterium]
MRLVYAYYEPPQRPLPTTGHGSAHAVAGAEIEMRRTTNRSPSALNGTHCRSSERLAQFAKLAQPFRKLAATSSVPAAVPSGVCNTTSRVSTSASTSPPSTGRQLLTTGWESIGAILTDVEFDYSQQITTLQFSSSDHAEFLQEDPEELKRLPRLDALGPRSADPRLITYRDSRTGRVIAQLLRLLPP